MVVTRKRAAGSSSDAGAHADSSSPSKMALLTCASAALSQVAGPDGDATPPTAPESSCPPLSGPFSGVANPDSSEAAPQAPTQNAGAPLSMGMDFSSDATGCSDDSHTQASRTLVSYAQASRSGMAGTASNGRAGLEESPLQVQAKVSRQAQPVLCSLLTGHSVVVGPDRPVGVTASAIQSPLLDQHSFSNVSSSHSTKSVTLPVSSPAQTLVSAVVSPAGYSEESGVSLLGGFPLSQCASSPSTAAGTTATAPGAAVVRYKIICHPSPSCSSIASPQQAADPASSSSVRIFDLKSVFSSKALSAAAPPGTNSPSSAVGAIPGAYTIIADGSKTGSGGISSSSNTGPIISPIVLGQVTPAALDQVVPGTTSLLLPSSSVRVASKPIVAAVSSSLAPTLTSAGSYTVANAFQPKPIVLHRNAASVLAPRPSVSTSNATSLVVGSTSAVAIQPTSSSAFSHLPYKLVTNATAGEEGEISMTWDKESTLMLINLYKEHKTYFKDNHYKKKSVWELIAAKMRGRKDSANFRWNHVENKWKNLTKKYRDILDMNRRNGTFQKCRFFDEIAAVYHYNPDEDAATEGHPPPRIGQSGINTSGGNIIVNGVVTAGVSSSLMAVPTKTEKPSSDDEVFCGQLKHSGGTVLVKKKKYAHLCQVPLLPAVTGVVSPAGLRPILPQPVFIQSDSVLPPSEGGGTDIGALLRQLRDDRAKQDDARMGRLEAMHREKMTMFGLRPVLRQPVFIQLDSVLPPSEGGGTDIGALLRQLRDDRAKQDDARMGRLEATHREKMTMFGLRPVLRQPVFIQLDSVLPSNEGGGTDIGALLRQLRDDRAKQDDARMGRLEAMHREKMTMFGKFLDFLKQSNSNSKQS